MTKFVDNMNKLAGKPFGYLLPSPISGSACKRLNLFTRWMVRRDEVDPGFWSRIPPSKLIIPLDTHMYKICSSIGFTSRKSADFKTAAEITASFREFSPEDPVKYDFPSPASVSEARWTIIVHSQVLFGGQRWYMSPKEDILSPPNGDTNRFCPQKRGFAPFLSVFVQNCGDFFRKTPKMKNIEHFLFS